MANGNGKKKAVDNARELVRRADAADQRTNDESTDVCGCNASTLPHKHLSRGIVDHVSEPVAAVDSGEEKE